MNDPVPPQEAPAWAEWEKRRRRDKAAQILSRIGLAKEMLPVQWRTEANPDAACACREALKQLDHCPSCLGTLVPALGFHSCDGPKRVYVRCPRCKNKGWIELAPTRGPVDVRA